MTLTSLLISSYDYPYGIKLSLPWGFADIGSNDLGSKDPGSNDKGLNEKRLKTRQRVKMEKKIFNVSFEG